MVAQGFNARWEMFDEQAGEAQGLKDVSNFYNRCSCKEPPKAAEPSDSYVTESVSDRSLTRSKPYQHKINR